LTISASPGGRVAGFVCPDRMTSTGCG
jgi:hypothetical protein